jgi:glutamate 5-kinase
MNRDELQEAKRIVVKVGTSTITHTGGKINFEKIEILARVLTDLNNAGKDIVLVTSGAGAAWPQSQKLFRENRRQRLWVREFSCIIMKICLESMVK